MSDNYLLAIDPVILLGDAQFKKLSKKYNHDTTLGETADDIKKELQQRFEFADVFQSTDETHKINVHEFLMADKTGERGMHDIGTMETPTELMAFVTVTDTWLEQHPEDAKAGSYIKLDPRIEPKKLHANDGATKDGKTAGFIRYDTYNTPVMIMLPDGPINYHDETVDEMEQLADEREPMMRSRTAKLQTIHSAFQNAKRGTSLDAFMVGWNLVDELKGNGNKATEYIPNIQQSNVQNMNTKVPDMGKSLEELSRLKMLDEQQRNQMNR